MSYSLNRNVESQNYSLKSTLCEIRFPCLIISIRVWVCSLCIKSPNLTRLIFDHVDRTIKIKFGNTVFHDDLRVIVWVQSLVDTPTHTQDVMKTVCNLIFAAFTKLLCLRFPRTLEMYIYDVERLTFWWVFYSFVAPALPQSRPILTSTHIIPLDYHMLTIVVSLCLFCCSITLNRCDSNLLYAY
jgi:hypothetical protein